MSKQIYDNTAYWAENGHVYKELQKFLRYVDFIKTLPEIDAEQKLNLEKIRHQIININQPNLVNYWCINIEIYNHDLKDEKNTPDLYNRRWVLTFEDNSFEISIKNHFLSKGYNDPNEYEYLGFVFFKLVEEPLSNIFDLDFDLFIEDTFNYKKYIEEGFQYVEFEIDYCD
jgi:hypothetical protein